MRLSPTALTRSLLLVPSAHCVGDSNSFFRPAGALPGDGFPTARIAWRTRPVCSQSLNGKRAKVLVGPRRLSVDVLNEDTGGLLGSRVRRHTYAVNFPHEAQANNNPRTEVHASHFFLGLPNGKRY